MTERTTQMCPTIRALVMLVALALSGGNLLAQAGGQGQAAANLVFGISIINTAPLDFGRINSPSAAGTVSITTTPNSATWAQGGTLPTVGGTVQPAAFTVNKVGVGGGSPKFWVEVPASLTLTHSGGSDSMLANAFNANVSPDCTTTSGGTASGPQGRCPNARDYNLLVGATLNVAPNQRSGSYAGTFSVTVHRY